MSLRATGRSPTFPTLTEKVMVVPGSAVAGAVFWIARSQFASGGGLDGGFVG
jgi:hypothetical protein